MAEAGAQVSQMDIELQGLDRQAKSKMQGKLRGYRADLAKSKTEAVRLSSSGGPAVAHVEVRNNSRRLPTATTCCAAVLPPLRPLMTRTRPARPSRRRNARGFCRAPPCLPMASAGSRTAIG